MDLPVDCDPFSFFGAWFEEAKRSEGEHANAMVLSTAGKDRVASRVVLLKGWGREGFVFYTNYSSDKARMLEENPRAALLFYWRVGERQVRIEGSVSRVSEGVSDEYFASRPLTARLGAWASRQSEMLSSREALEERVQQQAERWKGKEEQIARPRFWGGFSLKAERLEFWQHSGVSRLHDRFVFEGGEDGEWLSRRLYP